MRRLIRHFRETMSPPVFLGAAAVIVAFVAYGAVLPDQAASTFDAVQDFIVDYFG